MNLLLFLILLFLAYKISRNYAGETWNIRFDDDVIEIGSDKRPQQTFAFSQIEVFAISEDKQLLGEYLGLTIKFEQMRNGDTPANLRIGENMSCFSSEKGKKNYMVLKQFINDLKRQILQSQFKLASPSQQMTIRIGNNAFSKPAKFVYIHK